MCDQKLFNGEMLKDSKRRVIGSFVKYHTQQLAEDVLSYANAEGLLGFP